MMSIFLTHEIIEKIISSPASILALNTYFGHKNIRLIWIEKISVRARNFIYRIYIEDLSRKETKTIIAKIYCETNNKLFLRVARREASILSLLAKFTNLVPRLIDTFHVGSVVITYIEDLGSTSLAEYIKNSSKQEKYNLISDSINCLASLHNIGKQHFQELYEELSRTGKMRMRAAWYVLMFRLSLTRINRHHGIHVERHTFKKVRREFFKEVVLPLLLEEMLFIHKDFGPQHLMLHDGYLKIIDFETASIGPIHLDVASLLKNPDYALPENIVAELVNAYCEITRTVNPDNFMKFLLLSNVFQDIRFAGKAIEDYRTHGYSEALIDYEWYKRDLSSVLNGISGLNYLKQVLSGL